MEQFRNQWKQELTVKSTSGNNIGNTRNNVTDQDIDEEEDDIHKQVNILLIRLTMSCLHHCKI